MKTKMFSLVALMMLGSTTLFALPGNNEKLKVAGNCGMCEIRIENAAMSVDGVTSSERNKETGIVEVAYNSEKSDIHKVHQAIAKAGHNSEMHNAHAKVYNEFPGCRKSKRQTEEGSGKSSHVSEKHHH